jgi:hypothetical protein
LSQIHRGIRNQQSRLNFFFSFLHGFSVDGSAQTEEMTVQASKGPPDFFSVVGVSKIQRGLRIVWFLKSLPRLLQAFQMR